MSLLSIPSFTNIGYKVHARAHLPINTDLTGKTVVITGGTDGLGKAAARGVAALGARTVVVGRDEEKLRTVATEIGGDIAGYRANLSLMSEIRELAERLLGSETRIDVLLNNAGVLHPEREITSEGIEKTLATDLAGHFLLTNLLIPRLIENAPSRIINVTSGGMYSERIRPDDLQFERREFKGSAAYSHAKRGQVILTEMWAERLNQTGVTVHSMHPGWARTAGLERSLPIFTRLMGPLLRTTGQGADTMVWLAADPEPAHRSGELWFDRVVVPKHIVERTKETQDDRDALWDRLVQLTGSDIAPVSGVVGRWVP